MNLNFLKEGLLQLVYPRVCPVCGEILTEKNKAEENPFICHFCYPNLQFITESYCLRCGAPLENPEEEYCSECDGIPKYFDQGMALFVHDDDSRKILYDLKYGSRKDNGDFLGLEAAHRLGRTIMRWNPEVIIPVPLHKRRQFDRGFNQAGLLSEKLSSCLEKEYGFILPVDHGFLRRTGKTKPQKELSNEEREENVKGKFRVAEEHKPYRRVLLLDDIYTSGATINACAETLKKSGVRAVYFVTMSIVG